MLQQGSLFDNRYVLTRFIGRGGFAEVWLVEDKLTGLEEALKIYAPGGGMDDDGLKLFAKELSVVHDLRHSSLLTPKMLGQFENQPYLILPFCPNGSLNKKVGECTEEEAWKIMEQVASGLAYLHKRNIVHQDIKPGNILLDANNDCVITDFGISLKAQSTLRKSMHIQANSGTMAYMAPERFSAEPHPIPANDVWSLGAMMFELIEGNVPFVPQMGGLAQMNGAQIPTMHGDAGAELKQVILSMLNKDAAERPTAEQIVEIAKAKGAQAPKAAEKPKKAVQKDVSADEINKTQIINTHPVDNTHPASASALPLSRNGFVTLWYGVIIFVNVIAAIFSVYVFSQRYMYGGYMHSALGYDVILPLIYALFSLANIGAVWALFEWKKFGFWIILGVALLRLVTTLGIYGDYSLRLPLVMLSLVGAIISPFVLYLVLQISKDGRSCWSLLK